MELFIKYFLAAISAFGMGRLIEYTVQNTLKNIFEEKSFHKLSKRELYNEIIGIRSEGISSLWQIPPRSSEHCFLISTKTREYHKGLSTKLELLIWNWLTYSSLGKTLTENPTFRNDFMNTLLEDTKKLINRDSDYIRKHLPDLINKKD